MRRKGWMPMKCIVVFLLLAAISGCLAPNTPQQTAWNSGAAQTPGHVEEKEESSMENQNAVHQLEDIWGCSEQTAQSFCTKLEQAISGRIAEIEDVPNEFYRVLKITSDSGDVFFAKVMSGYFLSKVYADSLDGEVVYKAIR